MLCFSSSAATERTVDMSSQYETDYEKLYHMMNHRRGEEYQKLKATYDSFTGLYAELVQKDKLSRGGPVSQARHLCSEAMVLLTGLMDAFIETDRQLEACAVTQPEPWELDLLIESFLFRLNPRFHLKRFTAAKTALRLLLTEEAATSSMGVLYQKTAEQMGGTKGSAERNLRSFRKSAGENASGYYRENLAAYNSNNGVFYWNALRVLKAELNDDLPGPVKEGQNTLDNGNQAFPDAQ